jgi:hypothetical protein
MTRAGPQQHQPGNDYYRTPTTEHVRLDGADVSRWGLVGPQLCRQAVDRIRCFDVGEQHGQHRTLLSSADGKQLIRAHRHQRTEDAEPETVRPSESKGTSRAQCPAGRHTPKELARQPRDGSTDARSPFGNTRRRPGSICCAVGPVIALMRLRTADRRHFNARKASPIVRIGRRPSTGRTARPLATGRASCVPHRHAAVRLGSPQDCQPREHETPKFKGAGRSARQEPSADPSWQRFPAPPRHPPQPPEGGHEQRSRITLFKGDSRSRAEGKGFEPLMGATP